MQPSPPGCPGPAPRTYPATAALQRAAALVLVALFVGDVLATLVYRVKNRLPVAVRDLLDMSLETSLGTWLSVLVMASVAAALAALAHRLRRRLLLVPAGLFLFLSADDACMLHERLGDAMPASVRSGPVFPWLLALGPVFGLLGIISLWCTARVVRPHRLRLVVCGFACMAVAVAIEAFEFPLVRSGATWRGLPVFRYTMVVEENLELLGPVLLLIALVDRLESGAPSEVEAPGRSSPRLTRTEE